MFHFNNPYLRSSDHHQAGPHLPHHSAHQLGLPHAGGPGQEHPSGAGYPQGAQGTRVEQRQLQHLSQGCTHLQQGAKDSRDECYIENVLNVDYLLNFSTSHFNVIHS